ncbi:MAG: hypothetical protein HOQ43_10690 [Glycomyces artemisiae]|uniref:Uncharacterized protein n=1 Tax=Glycomyces artemisiae TaxID=1076443 RepID=A0A850CAU7_9ACTN|nr:hypothetical protein [Glycomyces artemisiae]
MQYLKAIVGALVAGLGVLGTSLLEHGVSAQEWTLVAVAFLGALGVIWGVPNKTTPQP